MTTIETKRTVSHISLSKRVKEATRPAHDGLDAKIMACEPFSSRERYCLFLKVQHGFHRDIDALYENKALGTLFADLSGCRRLGLIEHDLFDLKTDMPLYDEPPIFCDGATAELPPALGWLYVAEGSNLGAAILLQQVARLKLSAAFGARHLAGSPKGRKRQWRSFIDVLDSLLLSNEEENRVVAGAQSAFDRVSELLHNTFVD